MSTPEVHGANYDQDTNDPATAAVTVKGESPKPVGSEDSAPKKRRNNKNKDDKKSEDGNEENKKKDKITLKVFKYGTAVDWVLITLSIVINLGAGSILPIFMSLFGNMIDSVASTTDHDYNYYIKWQLILGAISFIVSWCGATLMEYSAERQIRAVKANFLRAVTRQEMGWFDTFDSGELASKLNDAAKTIREAIGIKLAQTFVFMGIFIGGYIVGFIRGWKMALVVTATLPLLGFAGWFMMSELSAAGMRGRKAYATAGSVAEEAFGAIRSVTAFGLQEKVLHEYNSRLEASFKQGLRSSMAMGGGLGAAMGLLFLTYALGFWYGGKLVADDIDQFGYEWCTAHQGQCNTGGTILGVFFCIVMAAFSIGQAGPNVAKLAQAGTAMADVEELIGRRSKIDPESTAGFADDTKRVDGEIRLNNVMFSYPARPDRKVFSGHLNVHIPAGKSVALVGASGCGKSTIVQLAQRFYDPDGGNVTIDGRDLKDYNLKWIRKRMALVSQEPRLFATTVLENIRAGREDATEEECIEAAKSANAHNFITQFPLAYHTYVGEGGGQLSGGQKQRIAIARAILRDPSILILDEATSALDNESEAIVQATLDKVVAEKRRTTIIIAHRLSTVRRADKIVVLANEGDGAFVIEEGTHEELLQKDGTYAGLVRAQLGKDEDLVREENVAELVETFAEEIPAKRLSAVRLRSKFSRLSRGSASLITEGEPKKKWWKRDPTRVRWHNVLRELAPYWPWVALALLGAMVAGAVWPVFSIFFSYFMIAFFQPSADAVRDKSNFWALMFIVLAAAVFIGTALQQAGFGWAGFKVVRLLRERTCEAYLYQDMEFFDDPKNTTGALSEVLSADILSIKGWIGDNTGIYLQNITGLVAGLIIAFTASAKLAGVALAACMLLAPAIMLEATMLQDNETVETKDNEKARAAEEKKNKGKTPQQILEAEQKKTESNSGFVVNETIVNIRTIAAYSLEDTWCRKYDAIVDRQYRANRMRTVLTGFAWGLSQFAQFGMQVLCLWYGGKLIVAGEIDPQKMMQGIFALLMAAMGAGQTMVFLVDNGVAQAAANKVYGVINRQPKIDARQVGGSQFGGLQQGIKFENVNFAYPQRHDVPIYHDLSFDIKEGEVVALVGPSGCGKSTAVQLVERFYDVSSEVPISVGSKQTRISNGAVYVNGSDIRDYNVQSLRAGMGLVNQEPVLFGQSIMENIACGKPGGATEDEVITAAKMANAYNFIMDFPDGFKTSVGKLGSQLSGGQKQRIAIARAIVRNPKVLILDEATSALDAESEKIVQAALDALLQQQKRSTIIIAHRLSTVRNADKIVVLANEDKTGSKVVEVGRHSELMAMPNGTYRNLVEIAEGKRQV